jgi:hypothetical protein
MKQFLAISLAILMLTTNMSVTFATHYCGGKAVKSSISLGHDDLTCGMTKMEDATCVNHSHEAGITKKDCCENKYTLLSVDDDFKNPTTVSPNLDFKFATAFIVAYIHNYLFEKEEFNSLLTHSPPLITQDRSVLFQVFRL